MHPESLLPEARRRLARRAGIDRWRGTERIPRLRADMRPLGRRPTVWFITPDWNRVAGGIRKLYRAADVLNEAGIQAAVVHERPGFACDWFDHETRIVAASDVTLGRGDVVAVPEIYGGSILTLPRGVRQVIFNQGAYLSLDALVTDEHAVTPYRDNPDLAAVIVVSDDSERVMRYAFPGLPVQRIRHGIDPTIHHPAPDLAPRRISYMTRRRPGEAAQVLKLLELRGTLGDWELVPIHGVTELRAAELLRESRIFLSFSKREGFGLPPLEALGCGCRIVGYDGFGGRELFRAPFATAVENGDVVAFARAVEAAIAAPEDDAIAASAAAVRFVNENYSQAVERHDLVQVFEPLIG